MYKITNNGAEDFVGRYDGIDFAFPVGQPVYCETDAANHIFGLNSPDKTAVLVRHGWSKFTNTLAEGMEILNSFSFEGVGAPNDAPLARVLAEPADHGPAPVGQDAPADAGGTDGSPATAGAVEAPAAGGRPAEFDAAFVTP